MQGGVENVVIHAVARPDGRRGVGVVVAYEGGNACDELRAGVLFPERCIESSLGMLWRKSMCPGLIGLTSMGSPCKLRIRWAPSKNDRARYD